MGDNKKFWNRYSGLYDFEINRFSKKAYEEMVHLMSEVLNADMRVLEVATGTGLIAISTAKFVRQVEATDFSPKMIKAAKKKMVPENVTFSIEDATALSFVNESFDAVIISNALHIMPDPVAALVSIRRVLKPGGLLIAPTFSHGHLKNSDRNLNTKILRLIGFETFSKWTPEEYTRFIEKNGFSVRRQKVLSAAFPLIYLEATKH
ncbi:class I SAM-dependent methyltransferase [Aminipila butyrica]|uniref:Class I SAM-dependent methyltransferase n=1 Tax=Aminipila butyrica TaxID=433296 RepID=A0A858BRX0_9FIRM|nr:class I SAM-dependent methyltransferase [Aminipila butyrica]QIB68691.1 class I SAM-dependent methyltransferase [Aminipila butyrica]